MTNAGASETSGGLPHRRSTLGRIGVGLGVLSLGLVALGAVLAKAGVLSPMSGFLTSTLGAATAALFGLIAGLIALVLAFRAKPRLGLRGPTVAVALSGLLLAVYLAWASGAQRQPPIHDVATDWSDPLTPSGELLSARGPRTNAVEPAPAIAANSRAKGFAGQTVAEINARTCPGAAPVVRAEPVDRAFTKARDAVKAAGLTIVTDQPAQGRLEATATSGWYGFKDDLIVRVRPEAAGARIDMRSISRLGVSDLGVNCNRVSRLRQALAG